MTIPQFVAGQVLTAAELNAMVDAINAGGGVTEVEAFTASGTFTVPAGVTYAVAHIRAGGGGVGTASAGAGGNSSVAFAGGTITATGGALAHWSDRAYNYTAVDGAANSGKGGMRGGGGPQSGASSEFIAALNVGGDGAEIVAGGAVTPAASITVTVGAGGVAGTNGAAGGSGYVWIEYQV